MPGPIKAAKSGRDVMGVGLAALNKLAGVAAIDRLRLRKPMEKAVYEGARTGFRAVGAANRAFTTVQGRGKPRRPSTPGDRGGLFDLTPTDEQQMIVEATRQFAAEQLRPAAAGAEHDCEPPQALLKRSITELGVTLVGIPESLGGMGSQRCVTTGVLVAEALAHGDMGLAVACLAPAGVSNALVLWGDDQQQSTYLPAFVGDDVPGAALAVNEPHPLFDPFMLRTTARRTPGGFVLSGVKSLVPRAHTAELFLVAADLEGTPALFLVESGTAGVTLEAEPAMGLRAAALGRLHLNEVHVPAGGLLGAGATPGEGSSAAGAGSSAEGAASSAGGEAPGQGYADCIRLARLGWCSLALGTARAVLDYVIPYVNERQAFGEPISHRQAVAFTVADIGIELEGARLVTLRAAARAEQGRSFARESALARRLTSEYGMRIGSNGVQLLGGHGYVKEHPVERWYRDLRAVAVMEGVVLV